MQFTTTFVAVVAAMATAVTAMPTTPAKPIANACTRKPDNQFELYGSKFEVYWKTGIPAGTRLHTYQNVKNWRGCLHKCTEWNKTNKGPAKKCEAVTWHETNHWCRIKNAPKKCASVYRPHRRSALVSDC